LLSDIKPNIEDLSNCGRAKRLLHVLGINYNAVVSNQTGDLLALMTADEAQRVNWPGMCGACIATQTEALAMMWRLFESGKRLSTHPQYRARRWINMWHGLS
jgi:hypothetical protein